MGWVQPTENSLQSLSQAMQRFDGIEFDLRLTLDGGLIIHHDREVSVGAEALSGLASKWVEKNELDDLMALGFSGFDDLLQAPGFVDTWAEQAKVICLELKVPHPSSKVAGGWLNRSESRKHISRLMSEVEERLRNIGVPNDNAVYYAFQPGMKQVAELSGVDRPVSTLRPIVPPYGNRTVQRMRSFPAYFTQSLSRLMNSQRRSGSPMIPCAIEYLTPPTNGIPLGRKVGLEGKSLQRLQEVQKGYPIYVYPGRWKWESAMLSAGVSPITDEANPEKVTLPDGSVRWCRPASKPLDAGWQQRFAESSPDEHLALVAEANREVGEWHELSSSERRDFLTTWRKRWGWRVDVDSLASGGSASLPWQAVRVIGHRGCGKTPHPNYRA